MSRRWLIVTQDFPPHFIGGVASWAVDLAQALSDDGQSVAVYARRTGETRQADAQHPFPVHRMWGRSWNRWQGLWVRLALRGRLDKDTVVICANWPLATRLVGNLNGARLAVAFHGSDLTRLDAPPRRLAAVVQAADALLPVSAFLKDRLQGLIPDVDDDRLQVLPMPLADPGPRQPHTGRSLSLVFVGRLTPLKGVDRAIRLARRVDRPLTIIGDGPLAPVLNVKDGVTLRGALPRAAAMAELARAAAIVLLPRADEDGSGAEGLGLCLLEAAARAVPGIGCDTGGVPEALGPGLLLDTPDEPDIEKVRAFLDDAPAHGEAARRWVLARHGPRQTLKTLKQLC
ncbi:MAG: glycosyltransferase family 4 protein [Myxococcota bacterium]